MFLNLALLGTVLIVTGKQISVLESILVNESLNTPGIVRLLEFNMELDKGNRVLKVDAEAETLDGVISFSEEIP